MLNKRSIRDACLGAVLMLPMATVTIIEDVGLIGMALLAMNILLLTLFSYIDAKNF